ncbi:MaoC/PaaZ C-terminal domain-containing protein [Bradyrhizobium sp. HKCCYLR1023]|uniref:MaoC/PaaZ C-terminal domain-containing protein n=1 Tax=Bradyrhizobium TaxID=374 RepID=UPI003EB7E1BA
MAQFAGGASAVLCLRPEDIFVGLTAEIEQLVERHHVDQFAALTGDVSPIHMDDGVARERGFEARVVHGMLIAGFVSRLFGLRLPGLDCILQSINLRWIEPLYIGDTIHVQATVAQWSSAAEVFVANVDVIRQRTQMSVAKGKVQVGFTRSRP